MAKFYVQCGFIRQVLTAESADQAALAVVDIALQPHLWIYDDPALTDVDCRDHLMVEALLHLDAAIRVSQRGFDRPDAELVGTPETIQQWHALIVAVTKLFANAGLISRNVCSVASTGDVRTRSSEIPRLPR